VFLEGWHLGLNYLLPRHFSEHIVDYAVHARFEIRGSLSLSFMY
jgi:hypothetical protein